MYTVQPMSIFSILISAVCCILLFLASGGWSSLANMDKILPRSLAFTTSTSDILTDKKSSAKSEQFNFHVIRMHILDLITLTRDAFNAIIMQETNVWWIRVVLI